MKEIEPTELELAKLKANNESINSLQRQMQNIQKRLQSHSQQNREIAQQIRERLDECPDTPLEKWDFSQVNWNEWEGTVRIPEEGDDE